MLMGEVSGRLKQQSEHSMYVNESIIKMLAQNDPIKSKFQT